MVLDGIVRGRQRTASMDDVSDKWHLVRQAADSATDKEELLQVAPPCHPHYQ